MVEGGGEATEGRGRRMRERKRNRCRIGEREEGCLWDEYLKVTIFCGYLHVCLKFLHIGMCTNTQNFVHTNKSFTSL